MKKKAFLLIAALLFGCSTSSVSSSSTDRVSEGSPLSFSSGDEFVFEKTPVDGVYRFYCVNDFHGSIVEQMNGNYYEAGIAKYFGKLIEYKNADPEHTFILSTGDMFQGSLESNDNYGGLVIEAMNEVGFDAMALGNHEFDYGQETLLSNIKKMDFPVLGANIMQFDNDITRTPWNDSIKASTIVERGGNKIGFVGAIGYGQTSSITSTYVQDIGFALPEDFVLDEAKRLREEGCAAVIYLIHDDMTSCQDYAASKEYFDGVFTGHRHIRNNKRIGGVPFVQSYCNGEAISHFELTIKGGNVTCTGFDIIQSSENWAENENIAKIRDSYIKDPTFAEKSDAYAGYVDGTLSAKEGVSNLFAKAIYEKYKPLHPELSGAFQNGLRAPLSFDISYRDIYKAGPFMNHIVIAKVLGYEIVNEAEYNSYYRGDEYQYEKDEYYVIACVDYVLYHQNDYKQFNYFNSLNDDFDSKVIADYVDYPFDIAFDYVHDDLNQSVDPGMFKAGSDGFGAKLL